MKSQSTIPSHSVIKQKGFTLIELIVVVVVLGFLGTYAAKAFSNAGITDASKAQALFEASTKFSQNTVLLAQAAGTSPIVTGSTLPSGATGCTTVLDVLVVGSSCFNHSTYPNAYTVSSVTAMPNLVQGTTGSYRVVGYNVTMEGGDNALTPHAFSYAAVPDGVVQQLVAKYGSNTTSLAAAGEFTNPVIRYGAPTAGRRTVTIYRPL